MESNIVPFLGPLAQWLNLSKPVRYTAGLYPIRKCPLSGPRTRGLGRGLDRPNHGPSATSTADRSAIRNTVYVPVHHNRG